MNRPGRRAAGVLVLVLVLAGVGIWLLPWAVATMPASVRYRLPPVLRNLAVTPLPTALPTALRSADLASITVPDIADLVPTPSSPVPAASPSPTAGTPAPLPTSVPDATQTPSSTPLPTATPTPTPVPLPAVVRIDGLTIVGQKLNNCGPANLSISLAYYGEDIGQLDIAVQVKPDEDDRNVGPAELVDYVNKHTSLQAALFVGGDLDLLRRLLAAGYPVVVEKGLTPSEEEGWMGHYLTLFGYDDSAVEFYGMDTLLGPWDSSGRAENYETLLEEWGHFNYTFYLVYPAADQAFVRDLLGETTADPIQMWHQAALRAQAETEQDEADPFAWFNLGSSLTGLGNLTGQQQFYIDAAAAFDRAREIGLPARMMWYQFEAYQAYLGAERYEEVNALADATLAYGGRYIEETFLYKGHAVRALGSEANARYYYRLALELNPNFEAAIQAME